MITLFGRANAHGIVNGADEHLAIADLSGAGSFYNGIDGAGHEIISQHNFDFDLRQKVDGVFVAAINFGVPLLTAKALHFAHRHPLYADAGEGVFYLFELEGFDDRLDLFHFSGADSSNVQRAVHTNPGQIVAEN